MDDPIRLLIVDDHPIVRHGIRMCLARREKIQIVGEAGDGREALSLVRKLSPDVVLMDIDMPQMNGLAVTDLLAREMPQVKVLILSIYSNSKHVLHAIQCGARGFVLKECPAEEIIQAIETVHAGATYFTMDVARVGLNQVVLGDGEGVGLLRLSNREREVRERIMLKLDIHSIAGLTRFAIAHGMVSLVPPPMPQAHAAARVGGRPAT